MQPFTSLPEDLQAGLTRSVCSFLDLRVWFIGRFGVYDSATAEAAIRLYRATLDPEIYQVHVLAATKDDERSASPSFAIPADANSALANAGFYRFRYCSVEEADGQYSNPSSPHIFYVSMKDEKPHSVLLATSS